MLDREIINWWKPILPCLDPWRGMEPEEVDDLYAQRPSPPSEKIAEDLLLIHEQSSSYKVIFCGARGSGKTTELTRIGTLLREDFAVIQLDVIPVVEDSGGSLAILTTMGLAALRIAQEWSAPEEDLLWPPRPGTALRRLADRFGENLGRFGPIGDALGDWVLNISAIFTFFEPTTAASSAVTGAVMKAGSTLVQQTGQGLRSLAEIGHGPLGNLIPPEKMEDARELVSIVNDILQEVHRHAGRPPLMLVDGLDRLPSLDAVWTALTDADLFRTLAVPLVFSGPIQVRHHEQFSGLPGRFRPEVLHNLPVIHRLAPGQTGEGRGMNVLLESYARRARRFRLPDDLFSPSVLRHAARMSAGIVRDFFQLLEAAARYAMRLGSRQVEEPHIEEALREKRHMLQLAMNEERYRLLRRVLMRGQISAGEESERLLFENYIACYPNGDLWFRPHEVLVPYLESFQEETE